MKKLFCLLLCVLFVCSFVLTACDNNPEGLPYGENDELPSIPEEEWVTLKFLHYKDPTDTVDNNLKLMQLMSKRTGVAIDWNFVESGDALNEQIASMSASDTFPDIFNVGDVNAANVYGRQGQALDVTDMYSWPDIAKYVTAGNLQDLCDLESGKIYQISQWRYGGEYNAGLAYRQDMIDELGINMPITTSDWYEALKAVKAAYPNTIPMIAQNLKQYNGDTFKWGFGLTAVSGWFGVTENGGKELVWMGMTENYKNMLTYFNKLYSEDLLGKDEYDNQEEWYTSVVGNMDFFCGSIGRIDATQESLTEAGKKVNLQSAMPMGYDATGLCTVYKSQLSHWRTSRQMTCISPKSQHIDKAKAYLYYMFNDEFVYAYNFGFEGVDHTVGADGKVTMIAEADDMNARNSSPMYLARVIPGDKYKSEYGIPLSSDISQTYYDRIKGEWAQYTTHREIMSYTQKAEDATDALKDEYNTINSTLNTLQSDNWIAFVTGQRPLSDWDLYIEQVKNANVARALEIAQPWLDNYHEKKNS